MGKPNGETTISNKECSMSKEEGHGHALGRGGRAEETHG